MSEPPSLALGSVVQGTTGGDGACLTLGAPHALDVRVYVSSSGGAAFGEYEVEALPWTASDARALGCSEATPETEAGTLV